MISFLIIKTHRYKTYPQEKLINQAINLQIKQMCKIIGRMNANGPKRWQITYIWESQSNFSYMFRFENRFIGDDMLFIITCSISFAFCKEWRKNQIGAVIFAVFQSTWKLITNSAKQTCSTDIRSLLHQCLQISNIVHIGFSLPHLCNMNACVYICVWMHESKNIIQLPFHLYIRAR